MLAQDHQGQIFPNIPGYEEVLPDKLPGFLPQAPGYFRPMQQIPEAKGATLGGMNQKPGVIILELHDDAPRRPADHRLTLPHGLGNRQAEAFPDGFLHNDIRSPLQGVDLKVTVRRQQQ